MNLTSVAGMIAIWIFVFAGSVSTCFAGLKAGTARVDLTPPLEMKASLGGYGERMNKPAIGIHDRIFAKALVVTDGDDRFAIVTADVLGFPPPLKPDLMEKLVASGWSTEQVLLLPSHSHTSIDMSAINPNNDWGIPQIGVFHEELYRFVLEKLVTVIRQAASGTTEAVFGTNSTLLEGWVSNRRDGETETDPVLTVTRVDKKSGGPLAVLVNWTAHPTFMDSMDMMFSGGWPGHLQRMVETLIGRGVNVLYYNGAEGDQSPRGRPDSGPSRWERAELYGLELGNRVYRLWQETEPHEVGSFSFGLETIKLPPRSWHMDFMETGGAEYGLRPEIMESLLEQLCPPESSSVSVRIGDLVIVGIPGELACGLGKQVKNEVHQATGALHVTIGGLADEWISYILSPEQYRRGGYEASVSFYGPELGPTIVKAAVRGASRLGR